MSFTVDTAFVRQYSDTIETLVQQGGSVLRNTVTIDKNLRGESKFYEQIGPTIAQQSVSRHEDSPLISTPHSRRRLTVKVYRTGDAIDTEDTLRMLIDPATEYTRNMANAVGRAIDLEIITQGLGTAYTGKDGATAVTLPSSQKVAVNFSYGTPANIGLTIDKLRKARDILGKNEAIMPGEPVYCVLSQQQLTDLLGTTQVTSADYNTVRALVNGEIDTFMGFKFIRTELLPLDTTTDYRRIMVYPQSAITLGIAQDIETYIARRADKSFQWYSMVQAVFGAMRRQEEKVVEITCDQSP